MGGWWYEDRPLLRPVSAADLASRDPTRLAAFPLVPYSNRIARGQFTWLGQDVRIRRNHLPEEHAIHGLGWQRHWLVAKRAGSRAKLILDHRGDADWPWPFQAAQDIVLSPDSLKLTLSATNLADLPLPLCFGYHPYFERQDARLKMSASKVWLADADNLPDRAVAPVGNLDFEHVTEIGERHVDNCYEQVGWPAQIGWDGSTHSLEISAMNLPCAVIYSSPVTNAFCVEPVAHLNNALNIPACTTPVPIVEPGQAFCCALEMRVVKSPAD